LETLVIFLYNVVEGLSSPFGGIPRNWKPYSHKKSPANKAGFFLRGDL
jgi:hypothetical protein